MTLDDYKAFICTLMLFDLDCGKPEIMYVKDFLTNPIYDYRYIKTDITTMVQRQNLDLNYRISHDKLLQDIPDLIFIQHFQFARISRQVINIHVMWIRLDIFYAILKNSP